MLDDLGALRRSSQGAICAVVKGKPGVFRLSRYETTTTLPENMVGALKSFGAFAYVTAKRQAVITLV
jgi:hypothetical protein